MAMCLLSGRFKVHIFDGGTGEKIQTEESTLARDRLSTSAVFYFTPFPIFKMDEK